MKYIALLSLLALSTAFADVPAPADYRYQTHFTKYSCKSFRDEASAPAVLTDLGMTFTYMSVDHNLKNAILTLASTTDAACEYRAHFTIDPKADTLTFVESTTIGDETCSAKKEELDAVLKEGFKYVQKYYYYFALKFAAKFDNSCATSTGNFMAEFELGKQ